MSDSFLAIPHESPLTAGLFPEVRALMEAVFHRDMEKAKDLLATGVSPDPVVFPVDLVQKAFFGQQVQSGNLSFHVLEGLPGALGVAIQTGQTDFVDVLWDFSDHPAHIMAFLSWSVEAGNPHALDRVLASPALPVPMGAQALHQFRRGNTSCPIEERSSLDLTQGQWRQLVSDLARPDAARVRNGPFGMAGFFACFEKITAWLEIRSVSDLLVNQTYVMVNQTYVIGDGRDHSRVLVEGMIPVLHQRFHAPNPWFVCLRDGRFQDCETMLPDIDWSLFSARSPWSRDPTLASAMFDGTWSQAVFSAGVRFSGQRARWTALVEGFLDALPPDEKRDASLILLSDLLRPLEFGTDPEKDDWKSLGLPESRRVLQAMSQVFLARIDQMALVAELVSRPPDLKAPKTGTFAVFNPCNFGVVNPDNAVVFLALELDPAACRRLIDGMPERLAPVLAELMEGAFDKGKDTSSGQRSRL